MKTTVYLQVEPHISRYSGKPDSMHVARTTSSKPKKPLGGTVTVKVTLDIPVEAFMPLEPEATIVIPAAMIQPNPIEVEAGDATDG